MFYMLIHVSAAEDSQKGDSQDDEAFKLQSMVETLKVKEDVKRLSEIDEPSTACTAVIVEEDMDANLAAEDEPAGEAAEGDAMGLIHAAAAPFAFDFLPTSCLHRASSSLIAAEQSSSWPWFVWP